jgi:16S rRNA U516 pseudouridylate synthase RsuA-like enzyme
VPETLLARLRRMAAAQGVKVSAIVRLAIQHEVEWWERRRD